MNKEKIKTACTNFLVSCLNEADRLRSLEEQKRTHEQHDLCLSREMDSPDLLANMQDGLLRMRITFKCNMHCEFCYQDGWDKSIQNAVMNPKWMYEYCKPLYERIKVILVTGGEVTASPEGYRYCQFLSEHYPQVNIMTESNGLAFNEKWQDMAVKHTFMPIFSVNAATSKTFAKAVWPAGGEKAFEKIYSNIDSLIAKQRAEGLELFAPTISMVINRKSAGDIHAFIKMALQWKCRTISFYFDHREGAFAGDKFACPGIMDHALKEILKIERVLSKKVFIYFKLWLPLNSTQRLQQEVEALDIAQLRSEYSDFIELAKDRDVLAESTQRQIIRKERGKKQLLPDEDICATLNTISKQLSDGTTKQICMAPYKELDLFATGRLDICAWLNTPLLRFQDFIVNDTVDWNGIINHPELQKIRSRMLKDNFSDCLSCCPLHPLNPHLNDIFKYGLKRERP